LSIVVCRNDAEHSGSHFVMDDGLVILAHDIDTEFLKMNVSLSGPPASSIARLRDSQPGRPF
jgi:hypothetical protein